MVVRLKSNSEKTFKGT